MKCQDLTARNCKLSNSNYSDLWFLAVVLTFHLVSDWLQHNQISRNNFRRLGLTVMSVLLTSMAIMIMLYDDAHLPT